MPDAAAQFPASTASDLNGQAQLPLRTEIRRGASLTARDRNPRPADFRQLGPV